MKKSVQLKLEPVTVVVEIDGNETDSEILEKAKFAYQKKINEKFPRITYTILDGDMMDDSDIKVGRPVKVKSSGELGIIFEVKTGAKFPISVVHPNGKTMKYIKPALEKTSKKVKIEKLIEGRQSWEKGSGWETGHTAFLVVKKEIFPVVVIKARSKIKAFCIGHEVTGNYYPLESHHTKFLFDTLKEAEEFLRTTSE